MRFILFAVLLAIVPAQAAPVRVTTWDLSDSFRAAQLQEAAQSLKTLQADVILLQHVPDWQTCQRLADALRPEVYNVVTCSAWENPGAPRGSQQGAILSKAKAYISWSEPWETPGASGGFCFAGIQLNGTNVGVFTVQMGDGAAESEARQLARKLGSLQKWKANRPEAYLVAGNFNATPDDLRLQPLGFNSAYAGPQQSMWMRNAHAASSAQVVRAAHFQHDAVTCAVDLSPPPPPPVVVAAPAPAPAPPVAQIVPTPARPDRGLLWLAAGVVCCLLLAVILRSVVRRPVVTTVPARLTDANGTSSTTIANLHTGQITIVHQAEFETKPPVTEEVRAGVVAELSAWLKQKMTRRLVSDRAQLLATQEVARFKVLAVDERLTKIENQIQQRNQDYEQRIDTLLKALVTAEEHNRELIRAQIVLLKAEMEKAKQRQIKNEDQEY